jgi:hypothetical protein
MRHCDKRRQVQGSSRTVDPFRIGCDCLGHSLKMPRCAGDVSVGGEKAGVFPQELNCDAWPCCVIGAGDIAAIDEGEPTAYQGRLFVMREGARLDIQAEIRPRRKAILACDAGLRVVQAKLQCFDFTIRAVCGGGKMMDEARDRCCVAGTVETQQLLRLLLQMVKIGLGRQLLHGGSSCIGWPKVRNTASTKDGEISDALLQVGSTLSADPEAACTASSDAMRWQAIPSTRRDHIGVRIASFPFGHLSNFRCYPER